MNPKIFIYFTLILGFTYSVKADIKSEVENIISGFAGQNSTIIFQKYILPADQKAQIEYRTQQNFYSEHLYIWIFCKTDSSFGIAILDNVLGKSMPITFLILFDESTAITHIDIIRYREPYGGAIASRSWLNQFSGKSFQDNLQIGDEVDSITGATISARSITLGIKKLSLVSKYLVENDIFMCPESREEGDTVAK